MTSSFAAAWLPLCLLAYTAIALYWARIAAVENRNHETFFSAGHGLYAWVAALLMAGASLSGWFLLGGAGEIARHGFGLPAVLQGGIALALPGTFFFKRMWFAGQRLRLSSQAELFRGYYESDVLVIVSTVIAVLFAVGFAGMQMRALGGILAALTGGEVSPLVVGTVLGIVLFGYVAIGGMRAVGYFGAFQSVLLAATIAGFAALALVRLGSVAGLNAALQALATDPHAADLFSVAGVIRFTAGLGRGAAGGQPDTSVMNLGLAFAFMGFQASPLAAKIVLSTDSARGFAAGQTWVMAGVFGALVLFGIGILGAAGLVSPDLGLGPALLTLRAASPWFMAWLAIGIVAGVQMLAGLGLLTAGEALVRHIYKPYFHASLSRVQTVNLCRVVIAVLTLASVLMQSLTPVTLSALGGLALPMAFQLWTPLLGLTWLRWITRPAAVMGVMFGLAGVLLTEPLGYQLLSFLGLELPWGRWPWTIHSAAWGMLANLTAVLIVSAITDRQAFGEEAREIRFLLQGPLRVGARARALHATAWSVGLIWVFLAIGPGLVFGNFAFGVAGAGRGWVLGVPSVWAWSALFWMLGVGFVWFLAYKMEMASPLELDIPAFTPRPRLRPDQSRQERARLSALIVAGTIGFALVVLIAWSFGH